LATSITADIGDFHDPNGATAGPAAKAESAAG
jgi:hypothetical protein